MQVHVGDALAHHVVQEEERAVAPDGLALRPGDPAPRLHELAQKPRIQIADGLDVLPGDHQGVTLEHRFGVEERSHLGLVEHPVSGGLAGEDAVENARGAGDHDVSASREDGRLCRINRRCH